MAIGKEKKITEIKNKIDKENYVQSLSFEFCDYRLKSLAGKIKFDFAKAKYKTINY